MRTVVGLGTGCAPGDQEIATKSRNVREFFELRPILLGHVLSSAMLISLWELYCVADLPVGIAGNRGKFAALVLLETDTPPLIHEGSLEALGCGKAWVSPQIE